MKRSVPCPVCGSEVSLDRRELSEKSARCRGCDRTFELAPEMFVGDGPLRALGRMLGRPTARPPDPAITATDEPNGALELTLRLATVTATPGGRGGAARNNLWILLLSLAFLPVALSSAGRGPMLVAAAAVLVVGACVAVTLIVGPRMRLERVRLDGDGLTQQRAFRFGGVKKVPFEAIDSARVALGGWMQVGRKRIPGCVRVLRRGAPPLLVAVGLGYEDEANVWIAGAIERKLSRLRIAAAERERKALPKGGAAKVADAGCQNS